MILTEFDVDKFEALIMADGAKRTLCSLVAKKVITIEQALEECGLTEKQFRQDAEEFGIELRVEDIAHATTNTTMDEHVICIDFYALQKWNYKQESQ